MIPNRRKNIGLHGIRSHLFAVLTKNGHHIGPSEFGVLVRAVGVAMDHEAAVEFVRAHGVEGSITSTQIEANWAKIGKHTADIPLEMPLDDTIGREVMTKKDLQLACGTIVPVADDLAVIVTVLSHVLEERGTTLKANLSQDIKNPKQLTTEIYTMLEDNIRQSVNECFQCYETIKRSKRDMAVVRDVASAVTAPPHEKEFSLDRTLIVTEERVLTDVTKEHDEVVTRENYAANVHEERIEEAKVVNKRLTKELYKARAVNNIYKESLKYHEKYAESLLLNLRETNERIREMQGLTHSKWLLLRKLDKAMNANFYLCTVIGSLEKYFGNVGYESHVQNVSAANDTIMEEFGEPQLPRRAESEPGRSEEWSDSDRVSLKSV